MITTKVIKVVKKSVGLVYLFSCLHLIYWSLKTFALVQTCVPVCGVPSGCDLRVSGVRYFLGCVSVDRCVLLCVFLSKDYGADRLCPGVSGSHSSVSPTPRPPRYSWILRYRRPLVSLKGHGLSPEMLCVWRWWWSLRIDCPFNQCCIEDIMNHILRTSDTHFKVGQMSFFFFCCCFFLWRHFTQTFIWRRAAPSSNAVVGPHVNTI